MQKSIVLLGATGSVGSSVLMAVSALNIQLKAFSFNRNYQRAAEIIRIYQPEMVSCSDEANTQKLKDEFPHLKVFYALEGAKEMLEATPGLDVVNAVSGMGGLPLSVKTLEQGRRLIIANKESIVGGSSFLLDKRQYENQILPIDSEHWSLFLLLENIRPNRVKELIVTASGGPFRNMPIEEMKDITLEQALAHPVWDMGSSITISSATMANKGMEVLEAKELFGFSLDKIKVMVHPQACIHGMIRLKDGSLLAHIGKSSMVEPARNALTYPEMEVGENFGLQNYDLNFEEPDMKKFPMLKLAYEAGERGQEYQILYTLANEIAVEYFLKKKIHFLDIANGVKRIFEELVPERVHSIEDVLECEKEIRRKVQMSFEENIK